MRRNQVIYLIRFRCRQACQVEPRLDKYGLSPKWLGIEYQRRFSMAKSYLVAFIAITLLMFILIGKMKLGLVSMVPNLLPILSTMGVMGLLHIPLDINSLMIGSIASGLLLMTRFILFTTIKGIINSPQIRMKRSGKPCWGRAGRS